VPGKTSSDGPAERRARFVVSYHGAAFHGFAENAGVTTVGGELAVAIGTVVRAEVSLSVAGRTDAGVHARGQVVSCDLPGRTDLDALVRSVNAMCGPHVSVRSAEWTDGSFDARSSATWRRYRYTVLNTPTSDPMLVDRVWHVREPLSLPLMNLACDAFLGEQDFTSFCRRPDVPEGRPPASLHRRVMDAGWTDRGEGIVEFDIRANAFCHQMVRSITGFLVEVGLHRRPPSDARLVLLSRDRSLAPNLAPPQGLTLWEVGYDGTRVHP
jgi:tRNA pseudouridine38-40 synthase